MHAKDKVDREIELAAKEMKELAHKVAVETHKAVIEGAAAAEDIENHLPAFLHRKPKTDLVRGFSPISAFACST